MKIQTGILAAGILGFCLLCTASADQVRNDDQIVQGGLCAGLDCVNGEVFNEDTLRLKENNLRIRFVDTTAADALGKSWATEANDSMNGGPSYFDIQVKSVDRDIPQLSDGTAIYACGPNVGQMIPAGQPVLTFNNDTGQCEEAGEHTVGSRFKLAPAASGAVAIGADSEVVDGAISVGQAGMLRQLKHVAQGLAATDMLIKKTVDDYTPFAAQRDALADIAAELDAIEAALDGAEMLVADAETPIAPAGGGGSGGFGLDGFSLLGLLLIGWFARARKRR